MLLRNRILFVFIITLAALLGTLYWVSTDTLLKSYANLENVFALRSLNSVQRAIDKDIARLDGQVKDWAFWDDTYQFIQDRNPDFITENLTAAALVNLETNGMVFLDKNGAVVQSTGVDLVVKKDQPVSKGLIAYIGAHPAPFRMTDVDDYYRGIIQLPEGMLMLAARPILTSSQQGPAQGTLIFTHYLDDPYLATIAVQGQELSSQSLTEPVIPSEVSQALESITTDQPMIALPRNNEIIAGYLLLTGLDGEPAGVIIDEQARYIYPQGRVVIQYFLGSVASIVVAAMLILWLTLYFAGFRRLIGLYNQVHQVSVSHDFTTRIQIEGQDEISVLAQGFDEVLHLVSTSRNALRASEEKYRGLVENLIDWVWEIDTDHTFTYSSAHVRDLLGFTPMQVVGQTITDLMYDTDAAEALELLAPCLVERKAFALLPLRFRDSRGRQRVMEVSGSPIFASNGELRGYRGISRDVTEHWEVENALHLSEEKYRGLFNYIPDAVYIYDRQTFALLDWNQAVTRIYGYSDAELRGFTPMNFYPPEHSAKAKAELAAPTLDCPIETTHLTKRGRRMDIEILMDAIDYQGRPAWIALVRDVTERKRTEDALRLERDIVQSIFASSPDAITIIDLNGIVIDCNQALLDMFGRPRKDHVIGDTIFDSIVSDQVMGANMSLSEAVDKGLLRNVEFICRRSGGVTFPTENSAGLLRDPSGAPRYLVVVSKDITERKRADKIQDATFRISQSANSSQTLDELFHSIYTVLNELFSARNLFFALYDERKDELSFPFFVDEYDSPPPPKKPGKGLTEYVFHHSQPILATPAVFDALVSRGDVESMGAPCLDWLGVPLKTKDRTIGVLVTQTYDVNRRLGEKEINILSFVSDQVAMAIDRKMAETLRVESEARLRRITDNMLDMVSETDSDGIVRYASPSHATVLGYAPETLLAKPICELLHSDDQEKFVENLQNALQEKRATRQELRFLHADGYTLWMDVMSNPLLDENGATIGAVHGSRDISGRKQAEVALRESEERYRNLVEYQGEGICILDPDNHFLFANPAAERIFGVEADGLTGRNLTEFIAPDLQAAGEAQAGLRARGSDGSYEVAILRPGGERRSLLITSTPWMDSSGDFIGSFTIFRDISERKQVEEKLHFLSMHDALTGLYNRAYFEEQILLMECGTNAPVSVVFTDLNGLKVTNDTLGHAAGDELLRQTAIMLRTAFRGDDVVARIGGDEFGVLLPGVDAEAAEKAVYRLRTRISEHNSKKNVLQVSISIGVATTREGDSLREMVNLADQRMYADKPRNKRAESSNTQAL